MLFGPVLKEIQAPRGIPTLDREHSHKVGNIHMGQGEHSHRAGIPKNLAGNNYTCMQWDLNQKPSNEKQLNHRQHNHLTMPPPVTLLHRIKYNTQKMNLDKISFFMAHGKLMVPGNI